MPDNILRENNHGSISQKSTSENTNTLLLKHALFAAEVSLYGGQVLHWQPVEQQSVFWLSNTAEQRSGKAIRGGIPICWPWFGGWKNNGNHGFARQANFELQSSVINADAIELTLVLESQDMHTAWPYHFKLIQKLVFSRSFEQTLTIQNLSTEGFEFSGALHSYFQVSNPESVNINTLNETLFDCKLSGRLGQQRALNNCKGPLDRIYHSQQRQVITDAPWQREIIVESEGCQQWVLWNPGAEVASAMEDVHKGGEKEFVCLEAANTKWLSVAAGEESSFKQKININAIA